MSLAELFFKTYVGLTALLVICVGFIVFKEDGFEWEDLFIAYLTTQGAISLISMLIALIVYPILN